MNIYGPSNGHEFGRMDPAHSLDRSKSVAASRETNARATYSDVGEASTLIEMAKIFARFRDQPEVREGVLLPIVSKLQSGFYNTPEAAQQLADAIFGQAELS